MSSEPGLKDLKPKSEVTTLPSLGDNLLTPLQPQQQKRMVEGEGLKDLKAKTEAPSPSISGNGDKLVDLPKPQERPPPHQTQLEGCLKKQRRKDRKFK